jgi:hypothetical protein
VAHSALTTETYRRRRAAAALVLLAVAAVVAFLAVALSDGGASGGADGAGGARGPAAVVPADALAYVNVSLDRHAPAVEQALANARRFPDFPILAGEAMDKLGAILGGGRAVDVTRDVAPWLGGEAAIALLNTTTATAGSLILVDVSDRDRARSFLRSEGVASAGSYRGRALLRTPNGGELAFLGRYLAIGQDESVRSAIDVVAGAAPSLAASAVYRRAATGTPNGAVIGAYASAAGVRRVLADQGGFLGAAGDLLYQPALQGVAISLAPTAAGARIRIHSALDPALVGVGAGAAGATAFSPSLASVMPAGASLMLDVTGLDKVAPQVLNAGSAAGLAGGIGPLLSRLGSALKSEGVDVSDLVAIFHRETAVAIVGTGQAPTLVIVARAPDQRRTQNELAQLEAPLAQLFSAPGANQSSEPVLNDRQVAGITAHQLQLATGFQLDYAVFRGLVVISTSLQGIEAVAQPSRPLARAPAFRAALAGSPARVTSLVFASLAQLIGAGQQTGLTAGSLGSRLLPDLQRVTGVGLTSMRGATDATTQVTAAIKP